MWVLLRPPRFGGAEHADDHSNWSRYREVGLSGSRNHHAPQCEINKALTDQGLPVENRQALVRDILGRAHPLTITLLSFVIESGRARDLSKIADAFVQLAASSREHAVAEIRSAVPLTDKQRERLQKALSRATGRTVEVKVVDDPTVIGGVVARVDDLVFDGSVASRLEDAKHALRS